MLVAIRLGVRRSWRWDNSTANTEFTRDRHLLSTDAAPCAISRPMNPAVACLKEPLLSVIASSHSPSFYFDSTPQNITYSAIVFKHQYAAAARYPAWKKIAQEIQETRWWVSGIWLTILMSICWFWRTLEIGAKFLAPGRAAKMRWKETDTTSEMGWRFYLWLHLE